MASAQQESVEDRSGILDSADHMRDMERLDMEVVALERPFASVTRVVGRIRPRDPAPWKPANQAVRIAVETPPGLRPVMRVYTIRSFDETTGRVEIDFVMHEDDSPAMRWLRAVAPGDRLGMIGPRQHFLPAHRPGKTAALFADETAIPAVLAILRDWPRGAPGAVWVETADRAAFDELPRPEGVGLHLLLRAPDQPAGTTGRLFAAAKAALADPARWTLWAAGERREMRDLRNHFRAGIAREDLQVMSYWKYGMSSSDLDRARLAAYEDLRERGGALEDFNDIDLPV